MSDQHVTQIRNLSNGIRHAEMIERALYEKQIREWERKRQARIVSDVVMMFMLGLFITVLMHIVMG